MKKPSTGRAKIEIKNLEDDAKKQVTFSKRRVGLMKKASELCVLCGADIAILVTSPKRKRVFAFGHPTASAVIDRFLSGGAAGTPPQEYYHLAYWEYNRKLAEAERKLAEEKRVATEIGDTGGAEEGGLFLWERSVEEMGVEELQQYTGALEEMRNKVLNKCVETAATTLADCVATSSTV